MTPYFEDAWLTVYGGDCRAVLRELPAESAHCVVTSPPYFGLRDYGADGQIGLEPTPDAYVATLVDVFREVRRVLRDDGTLWLVLGDSYATSNPTGRRDADRRGQAGVFGNGEWLERQASGGGGYLKPVPFGLKPKDLVGIPWRVAFALQADGWYLRSDIIWSKPNPMPESVTDRPTKSHEYIFLLAKSARYFWDADAVREPSIGTNAHDLTGPGYSAPGQSRQSGSRRLSTWAERKAAGEPMRRGDPAISGQHNGTATLASQAGRNLRSVWTIATAPYPGAHFATFPPKLVEPCIKAGTSERGVCPECGAPWVRVVERGMVRVREGSDTSGSRALDDAPGRAAVSRSSIFVTGAKRVASTTGWRRSCAHDAEPVPATCLDMFAGTGTVGLVAASLSRRAVLIDLNPDYLAQCLERNRQTPLGLLA